MPRSVNRILVLGGLRRGLLGGSRPWMALGVAGAVFRLLGRLASKEPKVVHSEELEAGHRLVVTHLPSVRPRRGRHAKMQE